MNQLFSESTALIVILATVLGLLLAWVITKKWTADTVARSSQQAQRLLLDAERDADTRKKGIVLAARVKAHELQRTAEEESRIRQAEAVARERALAQEARTIGARRSTLEQAEEAVTQRQATLEQQEQDLASHRERYAHLVSEQQRALQRVSGMTADEAKDALVRELEDEARRDAANLVKRLEHEARETAAAKAKSIVVQAIQRSAPEHAIETTVSVVDLPSDDLKGRIIGREGRNIRALEAATEVELIVDDTPGTIILSSFDLYRRTVAKQAIESLIADGRIHPARIEEVVKRVRAEVDEATQKEGEAAGFELGLHDLHPELYRLMGRLKFRTSYGQNVLAHSKEVPIWPVSWPGNLALTPMSQSVPPSCTTSAKRSTASSRALISSWVSNCFAGTAKATPSSTPWPPITWTSTGRHSRRCWCRPQTPSRPLDRAPAAISWSRISSDSRDSKVLPTRFRVSPRPLRFRRVERSVSWSKAIRSPTKKRSGSPRISPRESRTSLSTLGRSRSRLSERHGPLTTRDESRVISRKSWVVEVRGFDSRALR